MVVVNEEKCIGCGQCINYCPQQAISIVNKKALIDLNLCIECGSCINICPQEAISPGNSPQQNNFPDQNWGFLRSGFNIIGGMGRGLGRGRGRGLGRGPRDGRGRGGGGRW